MAMKTLLSQCLHLSHLLGHFIFSAYRYRRVELLRSFCVPCCWGTHIESRDWLLIFSRCRVLLILDMSAGGKNNDAMNARTLAYMLASLARAAMEWWPTTTVVRAITPEDPLSPTRYYRYTTECKQVKIDLEVTVEALIGHRRGI